LHVAAPSPSSPLPGIARPYNSQKTDYREEPSFCKPILPGGHAAHMSGPGGT